MEIKLLTQEEFTEAGLPEVNYSIYSNGYRVNKKDFFEKDDSVDYVGAIQDLLNAFILANSSKDEVIKAHRLHNEFSGFQVEMCRSLFKRLQEVKTDERPAKI